MNELNKITNINTLDSVFKEVNKKLIGQKRNGILFDTEFCSSSTANREGDIVSQIVSLEDINKRKIAEKELEHIFSLSVNMICITGFDGYFKQLNPTFNELLGYTNEELKSKPFIEFVHPDDRAATKAELEKIYIGKASSDFENRYRCKNGSYIWLEWTVVPLIDEKVMYAVASDITDRKKVEEDFDHIYNLSFDMICIIGYDNYFKRLNPAFEKILGYTADELKSKPFLEFIHPDDRRTALIDMEKIIGGATNREFENRYKCKDGTYKWLEWAIVPISEKKVMYAIARDVTERKLDEEELKKHREHLEELVKERTAKLKNANRELEEAVLHANNMAVVTEVLYAQLMNKTKELEQIIYVTSHDLRSPMVNIQGFSKELEKFLEEISSIAKNKEVPSKIKEKLNPIIEDDIPEAMEYIKAGINKMDTLLTGLLRFSRLGREAVTFEKIDMKELIREVVSTFEFQIKKADVTLDISEMPSCVGDRMQINQLFSNLLGNALKYLGPNKSSTIKISGYKKNKQVIYCVEDNGIGISKEHQEKIFKIFHRLDPSSGTGEGLGLTIVRKILSRHGGKIWLESEPSKGSKFFVSLSL